MKPPMMVEQFLSNGYIEKKLQLVEQSCDFVLDFKKQNPSKTKSKKIKSERKPPTKFSEDEESVPLKVFQFSDGQKSKKKIQEKSRKFLGDNLANAISNFEPNINKLPSPIKKTSNPSLEMENEWFFKPKIPVMEVNAHYSQYNPNGNEFIQANLKEPSFEKKGQKKLDPGPKPLVIGKESQNGSYQALDEKITRTNKV